MNDAAVRQDLAFKVALDMRHATVLARYPRKLKLIAVAVLALLLITPLLIPSAPLQLTPQEKRAALEERLLAEMAYSVEEVEPDKEPEYKKRRVVVTHKPETELEKKAASINDTEALAEQMAAAPDPDLVETSSFGMLPIVAKSGRQAWQVYARPFDHQDPRPRIAIVIGDMGMSRVATDSALHRMPANVTLAFDVHGASLEAWLERAHHEGHETLLSIPMEPYDYPRSDPGPYSLLTSLPNSDNIQRLLKFLGKGVGYVGVTTLTGSRFSADKDKISVVLDVLKKRGLMVFDSQVSRNSVVGDLAEKMRVPVAVNSRIIDRDPTPESIDEALMALEKTARVEGSVVAIASPLPVTLNRLELWAEQLAERGFVLAPLSAVVH